MGCSMLMFQGWFVCTALMSKVYPFQQIHVGHHPKVEYLQLILLYVAACMQVKCYSSDVHGFITNFFTRVSR